MSPEGGMRFDGEPPEEIRALVDELSRVLTEEIKGSGSIQEILGRIEESGFEATLSLAVLVGLVPLHALLDAREGGGASASAFDREFLASLNLRLPGSGTSEGE